MNHIQKMHLKFGIFFIIITLIVLFLGFLSATSFYLGVEELINGDVLYFGAAAFMGGMWGFATVLVGYQVLYQFLRVYLDERTLKVSDDCPNCEEKLDTDNVKWIEEEKRAACPYCGVELKVTKVWE